MNKFYVFHTVLTLDLLALQILPCTTHGVPCWLALSAWLTRAKRRLALVHYAGTSARLAFLDDRGFVVGRSQRGGDLADEPIVDLASTRSDLGRRSPRNSRGPTWIVVISGELTNSKILFKFKFYKTTGYAEMEGTHGAQVVTQNEPHIVGSSEQHFTIPSSPFGPLAKSSNVTSNCAKAGKFRLQCFGQIGGVPSSYPVQP